jgi:putative ABC transport system permease protein
MRKGRLRDDFIFPAASKECIHAIQSRSVMTLTDLFRDVLRTLWAHKLRAFLTMFGIAWGIVSIVLMVAAGEGLRKGQEEQTRNLGKDVMIVFHGRTSLQAGGTHAGRLVHWEDEDLPVVQAETPDCQYAIP